MTGSDLLTAAVEVVRVFGTGEKRLTATERVTYDAALGYLSINLAVRPLQQPSAGPDPAANANLRV